MDHYNYEHFDTYVASGGEDEVNAWFRQVVHVGAQAPDGELLRLEDGSPVRLADLWARRSLVLEFGSFT